MATSPSAGSMVHNASNPNELGNGSGNGDFHKVNIYSSNFIFIIFFFSIFFFFAFAFFCLRIEQKNNK